MKKSCTLTYGGRPELSTGNFSWTRSGETLTRPDPTRPAIADKTFDPTEPTARLPPPAKCTMVREFKIQVANREQYTIMYYHCYIISRETFFLFLFRSCNASPPESEKIDLELFYLSRPCTVSMQQRKLQISDVSKVNSKFHLNRSKL